MSRVWGADGNGGHAVNVLAHGGTQRAVMAMFRRRAFEVALTRARSQGPRVFKKRAVALARGSLQLLSLWRLVRWWW